MFKDLLAAYDLHPLAEPKPIGSGLMNETFLVETKGGKLVVQKIHAVVPDAAIEDMRMATTFLAEKGLSVPRLLPCNGQWFCRDANGDRWRVYPFIPGKILDAVTGPVMANEAGKMIGKMHAALKNLPYTPQGSIPHFHDTAFILDELRSVQDQLPDVVRPHAEMVVNQLPALIERISHEPKQLIHGDLKISNLLFDETGDAIGIIDFDTVLLHAAMVDMGDAYRSWCNKTSEDDSNATFDMEIFDAAFAGYEEGASGNGDRDLHLMAAKMITLELTARFLIDTVRDNYFGFDPSKYATRRDANIARSIGQAHLAQTIPL